jgi:hypothetical protein
MEGSGLLDNIERRTSNNDGASLRNLIQLGLTLAKALQAVSRFQTETRRRYAAAKSNALVLID